MVEGGVKGLFLFGEDPVRTDPDTHHVIRALEALEFFVVDDLFMTETAKYADVILPGRSYAEKEGTFTNTERRVQRVRKAVDIAGDTRLDTDIFIEVMNRMGYSQPHLTAAEVMDEIAAVTPTYGGMSHARLDGDAVGGRGLQWPCPNAEHPGTPILHMGEFAQGLGAFSTPDYQPSAELPDAEYPLVMMTGRILYQYNACAMTARTDGVNEIADHSFIELNTRDAEALGIADGDPVRVSSRRGTIARVREDEPRPYLDALPLPRRQQQLAHHCRAGPRVQSPRVQGVRREGGEGVRESECDRENDSGCCSHHQERWQDSGYAAWLRRP